MKIKYYNIVTEEEVEADVEDGTVTLIDDNDQSLEIETIDGSEGFSIRGSDSMTIELTNHTNLVNLKVA